MRAQIHNRSGEMPADGWYQIEVSGEHPAGKNRKQVIDAIGLASIVDRFNQEAAEANFPGILVDRDHLSHDLGNSTEALAWARELRVANGELEARLDLTDIGDPAVRNKRFKFFSTEYDPEDLEDLGDGRVRPLRLAGLAFTNRPNNRGARPISNRDGTLPGGEQQDTIPTMQPIALKLGLPADADEAAIMQKITDLMSELETLKGKEAEGEAEVIMNRYGDRIPKEKRDVVRQRLIANREHTLAMLDLLADANQGAAAARIFNRETAKQPATMTDDDAAKPKKAAAIRTRAAEIMSREKLPYNQAFARAQAELS